ncbi:MAG: 4'-phosphopantetheinyl transferase superfamily protein [Hyphomicrobiales bacterium]|nr:4'-phosphopantetheinyl transferase superfamily protein [Hyphomicrobiales bacterium]
MPLAAPLDDGLNLQPVRALLAAQGALIGARRIREGDEAGFLGPSPLAPAGSKRRRAGGAARIVARRLIAELGGDPSAPLARTPSGAPQWPDGLVGSLAHDNDFAVAAVAGRGRLKGIGVDIEPAEPLPEDIVDFVLSETERRLTDGDGLQRRLVFVAKEAVYKAVHPFDGSELEFEHVEVRLAEARATLHDGRVLSLVTHAGLKLIAVALLTNGV